MTVFGLNLAVRIVGSGDFLLSALVCLKGVTS